MRRHPKRAHVALVSLLAVLILAFAAPPVAAEPERYATTEKLAYRLINCLRTGGKVTAAGACVGYGSGRFSTYREPLTFSDKISNKVAAPYARRIATAGQCRHGLGGSTADKRFRTVGLKSDTNGENLACMWNMSPRRMVIYWVRHWFRETSYGGWHWRQIKDADFRAAGFGVVRHRSGRASLVVNFYGKAVD